MYSFRESCYPGPLCPDIINESFFSFVLLLYYAMPFLQALGEDSGRESYGVEPHKHFSPPGSSGTMSNI